jgi:hypothetical protein
MNRARRLSFLLVGSILATSVSAQDSAELCGTFLGRGEYELALNRFHENRFRAQSLAPSSRRIVERVGNIAVMEGDSRLVLPSNPFDLARRAVEFQPLTSGGYAAAALDSDVESGLGEEVRLTTNGFHEVTLPFSFPFYGGAREKIYVNANGSLTFNFGDSSSRTGGSQFLSSLPRIAAYYAPLDPAAGGRVLVASLPDRLVVTWVDVPGRGNAEKSTVQAVLEPSGRILVRFGRVGAPSGLVGLSSPFGASGSTIVDFSAGGEGRGTLFEEFRVEPLVDRVATARRFYESNPDLYDFIVLWTTFDSDMGGNLAFEATVRNNVRGIGMSLFNAAPSWGSRGQLQSFVMMGDLASYPDSPDAFFFRSDKTTLAVVAHEVGHRWLSFIDVVLEDAKSNALLGRGVPTGASSRTPTRPSCTVKSFPRKPPTGSGRWKPGLGSRVWTSTSWALPPPPKWRPSSSSGRRAAAMAGDNSDRGNLPRARHFLSRYAARRHPRQHPPRRGPTRAGLRDLSDELSAGLGSAPSRGLPAFGGAARQARRHPNLFRNVHSGQNAGSSDHVDVPRPVNPFLPSGQWKRS